MGHKNTPGIIILLKISQNKRTKIGRNSVFEIPEHTIKKGFIYDIDVGRAIKRAYDTFDILLSFLTFDRYGSPNVPSYFLSDNSHGFI